MEFDRMAPGYDAGRTPTDLTLDRWRALLARHLGHAEGTSLVDVGAGTGLWAVNLSRWFGLRVLALEPSHGMRRAGSARKGEAVRWVAAVAERLPLRDASAGAAWLSSVVHHLPDLEAAARELRRVVGRGGYVLIRNGFPGESRDRDPLYRFFPTARRFADAYPSVERVVEAFSAGGFTLEKHHPVDEVVAFGLRDYLARVRTRADSTLVGLSDDDFERGLASLERAAAEDPSDAQVVDRWEFLAFA